MALLVETAPEQNYKALDYNAFIALLAQGMKEQQAEIESLKAKIKALEDQ